MTWVWVKSNIELWGLWLKSLETNGAEFVASMPFNGPFAALLIASLILSAVTSFLGTNVRSIKDTFGVGTLIAVPSNLPLRLGKT